MEIIKVFNGHNLETDEFDFIRQTDELINPAKTSIKGVYVAGMSSGPMDIPDAISSAGAASSEVATYIKEKR